MLIEIGAFEMTLWKQYLEYVVESGEEREHCAHYLREDNDDYALEEMGYEEDDDIDENVVCRHFLQLERERFARGEPLRHDHNYLMLLAMVEAIEKAQEKEVAEVPNANN